MRTLIACLTCTTALAAPHAYAAFDACDVFTQAEAESVMEVAVANDARSRKRPWLVTTCSYRATKEGLPVEASVHFRFSGSDLEAQRAFDEARMSLQTKPFIMPGGAEAFWSARTGEMNLRKGRAWVTMSVGPDAVKDRDLEPARKLAEMIAKKL